MLFQLPHTDAFEIPDEWSEAAGMAVFDAAGLAYMAKIEPRAETTILKCVKPEDIVPSKRATGIARLERARMISLLTALRTCTPIPPIELHGPNPSSSHQYAVRDGMHRFRAAVAMGFRVVPALVWPYWDVGDPNS